MSVSNQSKNPSTGQQKPLFLFCRHSVIMALLLISHFITPIGIVAQGEANIWYFGLQAGLDFNGGAPAAITNGQLNASEGCASICDAAGSLLFYTDGTIVWDKNHVQMPNGAGLLGNLNSSTQSSLIVKKPGSSSVYYIFTTGAAESANINGVRYSEVDMSLNFGAGDITANKNILLNTPTCEKITGIMHCNGTDIWVVTHDFNSNAFRTYLVTSAGVNTTAVVSNAGLVVNGSSWNTIGQLKASPDGRKIASAIAWALNRFELFDFDNTTGIVSNAILFPNLPGGVCYGVEFSPDNTKLYGTKTGFGPGSIYQFDLCAGSNAAIANSGVLIGSSANMNIGSLQLGPDKKIYLARPSVPWIGVINSPNTLGAGCGYVDNGIALAGNLSTFGLPNFIQSHFKQPPSPFTVSVNCLTASFFPACNGSPNSIISLSWDFGDGSGTSTALNPGYTYAVSGTYTVTLILNYACSSSDTLVQNVTLDPLPVTSISGTTVVCNGNAVTLSASGAASYLWSTGATTSSITISPTSSANYFVTGTNTDGCDSTASITLNVNNTSSNSINPFTCGVYTLNGQTYSSTGVYTQTLTNAAGCDSILTINLTIGNPVSTSASQSICLGQAALIHGVSQTAAGIYSQTFTAVGGCDSVSNVTLNILNHSSNSVSPFACSTYTLNGQTYSSTGVYTQTLTNAAGCDSILTINLTIGNPVSTNSSQSICQGQAALIHGVSQTAAGIYSQTFTAVGGCDSVSNVILNILNHSSNSVSPFACSVYTLNGQTYSSTGVYTQTLTNAAGCDSILTINLTIGNPVSTSASQSICLGQAALIHGVSQTAAGIYSQTFTAVGGCDSVSNVTLNLNPSPTAAFSMQPVPAKINSIVKFNDLSSGASTWQWSFGDASKSGSTEQNPQFIYSDSGTYEVRLMISNPFGCTDTLLQLLYVEPEFLFYIPNTFSPNDDNLNDIFMPVISDLSPENFELYIFDRWGNEIFKTTNAQQGWDGKANGGVNIAQQDTYVWLIKFKDFKNLKHKYVGHVNLIK